MVEIGAWVLEEACRQASAWREASGRDLVVSVNVSGRQLADPSFPSLVSEVLAATSVPPGSVVLEMTETILLREHSRCESVFRRLKGLGVRLSIDDFGSGYSSLGRLRQFPVDQLKVDRAFVRDISEHGDTRIMRAVVDLAHDFHLEVVAEGVETDFELASLRQLGCDLVQGFLLGKPAPPATVEAGLLGGGGHDAEGCPPAGGRVLSEGGRPAGRGSAQDRHADGSRT